jgi:hypothetical protein
MDTIEWPTCYDFYGDLAQLHLGAACSYLVINPRLWPGLLIINFLKFISDLAFK